MTTTEDSNLPRAIIAGIVGLGIVAIASALIFATPSQAAQNILNPLLGSLTLALGAIVQFYFGSSAGAKVLVANQNDTVKTMATALANSAPVPNADPLKPSGTPDDPVSVTEAPKLDDPELASLRAAHPKTDEAALQSALRLLRSSKADVPT